MTERLLPMPGADRRLILLPAGSYSCWRWPG